MVELFGMIPHVTSVWKPSPPSADSRGSFSAIRESIVVVAGNLDSDSGSATYVFFILGKILCLFMFVSLLIALAAAVRIK